MKVIYDTGKERCELKNCSITISPANQIHIEQKESIIDVDLLQSLDWKCGDVIIRKEVSRIEPNYFIFWNFGTISEHGNVNVGTHIRFIKDRLFLGGYAEINPLDYEKADLQKKNDILVILRDNGYGWNKERSAIVRRAKYGYDFYFISDNGLIESHKEEYDATSNEKWSVGNYFLTEEECKSALDEIAYVFERNKILLTHWKSED